MTAPLPTNDALSAMGQATATAGLYLDDAINAIDARFGDGYAKKHPELIGAFMQTAAADYTEWGIGVCTAHLVGAIDGVVACLVQLN